MTQLRESPLGEKLHWLARVRRGEEQANQDDVFRASDEVLDLLFWAAGEEHYELPRAFWTTSLGRMLAEARLHVVSKDDLMSVGEAAAALGVTRPTVYRWLGDQTLDELYDNTSGRTFVLRDQVEHLKSEQSVGDKREVPLAIVDEGQEMSGAARD
jgi:excisionase family DNA binding protein